ncbi:MAG: heavy metal translocating P-type ATPase [Parachlamydiaceae bacterium]
MSSTSRAIGERRQVARTPNAPRSRKLIKVAMTYQKPQTINLHVDGISCHSCVRAIESAVKNVPGVDSVHVNFATNQATVVAQSPADECTIIAAIDHAGYRASPIASEGSQNVHSGHISEEKTSLIRLLAAIFLSLPFFVEMIGMLLGLHLALPTWLQCLLATAVQFGIGWIFYRNSYYSLRHWTPSMDVLIVLGTTAAYFLSLFLWWNQTPQQLYFETSVAIITLVLFGRWLEARSKGRASESIGKLLKIQPSLATVQRNGAWKTISLNQVVKGDIVLVKSGERIPVDADVVDGESEVDESMITGESIPSVKRAGEKVLAGTLNQNGSLTIRAVSVGYETILAGMIRLVENTQASKAPIQRLADAVSSVFVPVVLAISVLTFCGWWIVAGDISQAVINAVSVLVIACPCALGLATPIVIVVASGCGAKEGILFKDAAAIETAHQLNVICFDKTGTLTEGKPELTDIIPMAGYSKEQVLQVAQSLEIHVQHPLARAILKNEQPLLLARNVITHPGKGVIADIEGKLCGLGASPFAHECGLQVDESAVAGLELEGKTVVVVWNDQKIIGYLALRDRLREHSADAIRELNELGIEQIMLTGDHAITAAAIAKQAGIVHYQSGMLPRHKLDYIEALKKEGKVVGMVGDGINDAPALTMADVGIALGAASDVAMESATIALMRNNLMDVVKAISLSRAAFRKIKQNLFFAFFYNILGIPLAAFGMCNPIIAAAAMAVSSLSVVLNALLLRK